MGYIGAAIETPQANFTTFRAILDQELAAMAAKPVSDDELKRALQPLIESATKRLENNDYWIGRLPLVLRNPALKPVSYTHLDVYKRQVYMFNFPKADAASLDTGLMLFREIGGRLKLDDTLVEAEKGVILSEERLRDTPPYRALKANLGNALAGTRAVQRWPIGTIETIKTATGERLRRYYNANYRPDNATLIVVGNIDPAKVETEIKARFADWRPAGTCLLYTSRCV